MEYICKNPECEAFNKADFYATESYVFTGGKLTGRHALCPKCGKLREVNDPNVETPLSEKNLTMNFFNGMSMEQKKAILKKRSHDDYNRHIREKREGLLEQAKQQMREHRKG